MLISIRVAFYVLSFFCFLLFHFNCDLLFLLMLSSLKMFLFLFCFTIIFTVVVRLLDC